jgi:NADH-quinone oxidoreductase subunit E
MLSITEKQKIEDEIKKFPKKSAACIEALKIVQEERKWVPDEAVQDIAGILEMTTAEVDSVATFYNLIFRKPVGRHVILLCDSISCFVMGYEKILDILNEKLGITFGETTDDNRFTLLPIQCLGNCDLAPTMMIDNDLYSNLNKDNINGILEKYQ